jgi:hypothetical protein
MDPLMMVKEIFESVDRRQGSLDLKDLEIPASAGHPQNTLWPDITAYISYP